MVKPIHWITLVTVFSLSTWIILKTGKSESRIDQYIDLNWRFTMQDDSAFSKVGFDDADWEIVALPHDWMIRMPVNKDNPSGTAGGFYPGGIGWYRKHLDVSDYAGKDQFYLAFEGVYMNADIWVNGHYAGRQGYGYIGFDLDVTDYLVKDTINIIAVRTDCSKLPSDRWYSGAGIYRHVRIIATEKLHFPVLNTKIASYKNESRQFITVTQNVVNNDRKFKRFKVRTDLLDPEGNLIESKITARSIDGKSTRSYTEDYHIESPEPWSPDSPNLYEVRNFIIHKKQVTDNIRTMFGIRDAQFTPDSGFVLNGKKVILKGVCIHHDGGALGAAVPAATWKYRLETLREIGVNALRLAHNPHSPELLDLCDRMGFLVINEMYDKWELQWSEDLPAFDFPGSYEKDLTYFINRDINHPSVIAWSLGNETVEQLENPELGVQWYRRLIRIAESQDSSRMFTCGLHPDYSGDIGEVPSSYIHVSPLVSYNYRTDSFPSWHRKYPDKIWLASETRRYNKDRRSEFQKISYRDNAWFDLKPFVAGQFIWAGIDYLGETMGWPDHTFRNGLLTTSGEIKPGTYFTQSIYSEEPMVKIAVLDKALADSLNNLNSWQAPWFDAPVVRHWNFGNDEKELQIVVYTNCSDVDLTVNGVLADKKQKEDFLDGVIKTTVRYKPGIIMARAACRDEEGSLFFVTDSLITSMKPLRIHMDPDRPDILADGKDVVHIRTSVTDSAGITYPTSNHLISYKVQGPGNILAIDNGDPADHNPNYSHKKRAHRGTQLLIVQSTMEPGDLIIKASSDGLEPAKISIRSLEPGKK
ncbi:MAG: DUF4982 domain-containing protein [Bacteroidales bacterium]|nr:DUF4982 domain-containing protein [Bacteroidales bacterium]